LDAILARTAGDEDWVKKSLDSLQQAKKSKAQAELALIPAVEKLVRATLQNRRAVRPGEEIVRKSKSMIWLLAVFSGISIPAWPQRTEKPVLHGRHWVAITGKPLAATAGAQMFLKGGNAVDAACAMLGAVCTMWDVLSWEGRPKR